jgi:hypothetical protein
MKTQFLEADSPRWSDVLAEFDHDVYHQPGFARLFAREEGGEASAFLAEDGRDRLLIPLIVRPIDPDEGGERWFDATCPYGYAGPILGRSTSSGVEEFLDHALERFLEELRERRILGCFSRIHPLLELPLDPFRRLGAVVHHGETVSIDLTQSLDESWRQMHPSCRQRIRRTQRQGQVGRLDPEWQALDTFLDIYHETMVRRRAARSYFFSREHILGLRQALGDRLHLSLVEMSGEIIAAALFFEANGIANYHLGGTRDGFVKENPSVVFINQMRTSSFERGNRVLHLGGGVGGHRDSLFNFKANFSNRRHPFHTWRVVADESAYRELTGRWRSRTGETPDDLDGFFPAYRKPARVIPAASAAREDAEPMSVVSP